MQLDLLCAITHLGLAYDINICSFIVLDFVLLLSSLFSDSYRCNIPSYQKKRKDSA